MRRHIHHRPLPRSHGALRKEGSADGGLIHGTTVALTMASRNTQRKRSTSTRMLDSSVLGSCLKLSDTTAPVSVENRIVVMFVAIPAMYTARSTLLAHADEPELRTIRKYWSRRLLVISTARTITAKARTESGDWGADAAAFWTWSRATGVDVSVRPNRSHPAHPEAYP